MGCRTRIIVRFRVGSELGAALRARPCLRRTDQLSPNAVAPRCCLDEPTLQITHSIGSTTLGVRANGDLGEADQTRFARGDQDCTRRTGVRKGPLDLLPVLGLRSVRPQGMAKTGQRRGISGRRVPDLDHRRVINRQTRRRAS